MNPTPRPQHYKTLIIGLDGATFDLMLPWVDEGILPNLGKLIHAGSYSPLQSTTPPITPCAWSSFMTGKNPGKHGLFDFVERKSNGRGFRFTNASARYGETLWGCLGRHGRRVGVINVPMTFPPEQVNGYLLSGLDTPHEGSKYSYPEGLRDELRHQDIPYRVDLRHLGDMRTDRRRDRRIRDLHEMESIRTRASRYLHRRYPTDFTMVVYIASDQVQHHFWHYMDENHDKHDREGATRYGHVIRDTYIHLDKLIGELLEDIDDHTIVVVMSDHGFGPTTSLRVRGNQVLANAGLLNFKQEAMGKTKARSFASIADRILRSTLSPGVKAWLSGTLPRLREWFETVDEAQIEWDKTEAFVNEAYRANPAVWLNDGGDAATAPDVDRLLGAVRDAMTALRDPGSGEQVVSDCIATRDVYSGPFVDRAPDLLLSWWNDGFLLEQSVPTQGAESAVERSTVPIIGGVEFAATHKMDGVFIIHGGPAKKGYVFSGAEIIDVAPTVLHLMGHPIPLDMDGRPLMECLDDSFVKQYPPRYETVSQDRNDDPADVGQMPDGQDERMVARRLQALGYID